MTRHFSMPPIPDSAFGNVVLSPELKEALTKVAARIETDAWQGLLGIPIRTNPFLPEGSFVLDGPRQMAFCDTKTGKGYSIDRIDSSGHYSCGHCEECRAKGWPLNCRWSTLIEQGSNKRNNRTFEYRGVRYTIAEAVRAFGIPRGTLINRHRKGWTGEQIVNQTKMPGMSLERRFR